MDGRPDCTSLGFFKKELKTFVENRMQEIGRKSNLSNWLYWKTEQTPSDILTLKRLQKFCENRLWRERPDFWQENCIHSFNKLSSNREKAIFNELKLSILLIDNVTKDRPADLSFEHTVDTSLALFWYWEESPHRFWDFQIT